MGYYKDKLYRVFLGNPPQFMLDVPEDITPQALALQGVNYTYGDELPANIINVNYVRYIQDISEINRQRNIQEDNDIDELEKKRLRGIFWRSEYNEFIQDINKDDWQKVYFSFYFRSYLTALSRVYNYHPIDNQDAFVAEILACENGYTKALTERVNQQKQPISISDTEFIKGSIQYCYPVFGQSTELIPKDFCSHLIEIKRKDTGEIRTYLPLEYAELHLINYLEYVNSTENYNEKMLTLNNAKHKITELVDYVTKNDKHNLSLGNCTDKYDSHNFNKIFERINNAMEYLRVHSEFETTQQPPKPPAAPTSEPLQTITEKLRNDFRKYGFFELEMIEKLKENGVEKLIVKISENKLPYKIAMIHFLGFIEHLQVQHFKSKDKLHNEIGSWFGSTKREISGNIRVLNPVSKEDRQRYTADQHTGKVKGDYNKLK